MPQRSVALDTPWLKTEEKGHRIGWRWACKPTGGNTLNRTKNEEERATVLLSDQENSLDYVYFQAATRWDRNSGVLALSGSLLELCWMLLFIRTAQLIWFDVSHQSELCAVCVWFFKPILSLLALSESIKLHHAVGHTHPLCVQFWQWLCVCVCVCVCLFMCVQKNTHQCSCTCWPF